MVKLGERCLLQELARQGLLNSSFFTKLVALRPGKAREIERVGDLFQQADAAPSAAGSGRWFSLRLRFGRLKILIMLALGALTFGLVALLNEQDTRVPEPKQKIILKEPDPAPPAIIEIPGLGPERDSIQADQTPPLQASDVAESTRIHGIEQTLEHVLRRPVTMDCLRDFHWPFQLTVTVAAKTGRVTVELPFLRSSITTRCVRRSLQALKFEPGERDLRKEYVLNDR